MSGLEIGTVAGWVTAASTTGMFAGVALLIRAWWKRGVDLRTLNNAEKSDIRDHYAAELERQGARAAAAQEVADRRLAACEESGARHRTEISKLRDEVDGLKRQVIRYSATGVIELASSPLPETAPEAVKSAPRVLKIIDDKENGGDE